MKINLIPASPSGVYYGGHVTNAAIKRFRPYLLGFVVVAPSYCFEFDGDTPTPENITKAEFKTVITLFREPNTIGQVTGFIHLKGMNINVSGTGGVYGKEFLNCLVQHQIQPWFYNEEDANKEISKYAKDEDWYFDPYLSLDIRIEYWEKFTINKIMPMLYTELITSARKTGTWIESWSADDN